jgi:hypothetical protein
MKRSRVMNKIISEILAERKRQDELWGEQNHPIIARTHYDISKSEYYRIPEEKEIKVWFNHKQRLGKLTYFDILLEEVVEVANCTNADDLRKELIQVAAVTVAMIESLERNGK